MNTATKTRISLALLLCAALPSWAQQADSTATGRTVTKSYMIGDGPQRVLDTYLSNEHFRGEGMTFLSTREARRDDRQWSTLTEHQANLSYTHDRAEQANEIEGSYDFYIGRFRRWTLLGDRLELQAGGMADVGIGFIYNTLNGNNPAQGRLHLNVMPSGTATYRFQLWRKRMAVRYELQVPLVGVMFSPQYGQSYYELFSRGNYDHNVVPTTFVSAPCFRQQILLDVNLRRTASLRVGYLGDYQQSSVNHLKSHIYSHRFIIGFVKRFSIIRQRP